MKTFPLTLNAVTVGIVCLAALLICACEINDLPDCPGTEQPPTQEESVSFQQGIWGDVWFWEGDFMPVCPSGHVTAVVREVHVYTLTNMDDVVGLGYNPFYRTINTQFVDSVFSNSRGFFEIALDTGWYSVFVREDSLFYANGFDGQGNIFPVHVTQDSVSGIAFDITYMATY